MNTCRCPYCGVTTDLPSLFPDSGMLKCPNKGCRKLFCDPRQVPTPKRVETEDIGPPPACEIMKTRGYYRSFFNSKDKK